MVVIEFVNEPYNGEESVGNLIRYAAYKYGTVVYSGSINAYLPFAEQQFNAVRAWYGKTDFRKMRQIIISFAPETSISPSMAYEIGRQTCMYYADRYQIVFGVHEDTDNLHIHIVFNTVGYKDGKLYSGGRGDYFRFRNYVNEVISRVINF